jgi:microcystin-dependent protein
MQSNYPGGFANGVTIRGVPLVTTNPGKVYWVYNGTALQTGQRGGSDGNKGTYDSPFSTIDYAVGQCVANRGDIIFVKPGHAETISTAAFIALDVAGVTLVGLGKGASRPTLTWSAADSTITVAASNITMHNFLFVGSMATTFTVTAFSNANAVVANDFTIDSCEFRDLDATHGFIACVTTGTTANQGDGLTFTNNKVLRKLTSPPAANTAVVIGAAIDRLTFGGNYISNKTVNNNIALGFALGANAVQNLNCYGNRTYSLNTGTTAGELFSGSATTCSGLVHDNYSWHLAATGLLAPTGTKLGFVENYCSITGAADKSALINPVAV